MSTESGKDRLARVVGGLCVPVAIYVAFWRIDWSDFDGSLLRIVLPVAFCVIVPSAIGSAVAAIRYGSRE